ncbi:unnamed protein product [Colias eurytheme]|nr:unnamed protein product [Colias eurytheme]
MFRIPRIPNKKQVHQTCEDLLLHCSFNRKAKDCSELFRLIKTYEGHCCAFNYAALNDDTVDAADDDDDIERYDDESENEQSSNIIVTSESGRGSGLGVVLNVEPNDYGNWSLVPFYGAKILVCDPNDYPEVTVLYKYVGTGVSLDIKVQPMIFQSDDEIRRIDVEKRGCIFHDEGLLEHTDRYSTETCITECRMKMFLTNCGCIPYKYPKERETRICEFKDLECLNKFRARGMVLDDCTQVCYMECRDKRYAITSDVMPLVPDFYPYDIIKDHNLSEITTLQVYFDKSTCNCYKQMLLMDLSYFIATYGGIFFAELRCVAPHMF